MRGDQKKMCKTIWTGYESRCKFGPHCMLTYGLWLCQWLTQENLSFIFFVNFLLSLYLHPSAISVSPISTFYFPPNPYLSPYTFISLCTTAKKIIQIVEAQRTINFVLPIDRALAYFYLAETEIHWIRDNIVVTSENWLTCFDTNVCHLPCPLYFT